MLRLTSTLLLSISLSFLLQAQNASNFNTTVLSVTDDYNIGDRSYNEVWGFTDRNGLEYAILGGRERTIIYEIDKPKDPIEVANIPGPNSIWRDMKSFGDYIYVVADRGTEGLLIIDMSEAPGNITFSNWKPFLTVNGDTRTLEKCHNLYIDENGIAYLSGCNVNGGGVLMVDLATEPGVPQFIGPATSRYSHDVFVRGDTVYSSDLSDGFFSITDVSNKQAPRLLATQQTTRTFTHNVWLSDDGNYLFTTDEKPDAFIDAYDISDLEDIKLVDTYRPIDTENTGVIPHNVHYKDGFLVISYYSDGIRIVDASRPENLIEVGGYDTTPKTGSQDGCWGAFPYLPSGLVLASDMNFGLFVLEIDYKRAAYLEGIVTDALTGLALNDVEITIQSPAPNFETTAPNGSYRTGHSEGGTFRVTYDKAGYNPVVVETEFINGEITIQDIEMNSLESREISGTIRTEDGSGIPGNVSVYGRGETYTAQADENGNFILNSVPVNVYNVTIGAWGYQEQFIKNLKLEDNDIINVTLIEGYQDGFAADQGWIVESDASTGDWEREVPIGTAFEGEVINPAEDDPDDNGNFAFVTDNELGAFNEYDVDNGTVTLSSPIFDLSQYENPLLSYSTWFYNGGDFSTLNDDLSIYLSNGDSTILLEQITTNSEEWRVSTFELKDLISLSETMQLVVQTADLGEQHLVEAGFDAFQIVDQTTTSNENLLNTAAEVQIIPNPFSQTFDLRYQLPELAGQAQLRILNQLGQIQHQEILSSNSHQIQLSLSIPSGIYYLQIIHPEGGQITKRLIKQ